MSKEMRDYRKEQEIRQAAELKAKLDMVELRDKPAYGRPPKKIGTMICDTGLKTGYRTATAEFVLRLDSHTGEFIAEHGDFWYVSKSRDALKAKMDEVARVTLDLNWTRYLRVKYTAHVPSRDSWRMGYDTTIDIDDKRDKDRPVFGVQLEWEVVEYSDPIRLPGDEDDRFMKRDVDSDGDPESEQESVSSLPAGLVPYTKEREELLKSIRDTFAMVDKKMVELLSGTPEQVAKRLDAKNGQLLLAAPPKKAKR